MTGNETRKSPSAPAVPTIPIPRSPDARHVLVVDDSPAARDWMHRVLGRAGYSVSAVASAAAAFPLAVERPDLIICDVQLPDESGLTLTSRLRGDPRTADIPLLQVSAVHIAPPDRVAGLHSGADAYLAGPLDPDEVLAVAEALLRARAAEHDRNLALERLGRLQAATAALARAGTPEDVLGYLAEALRTSFGANGVGIGVLGEKAGVLDLLVSETAVPLPRQWPVDDTTPFGRAVREQAPVVLTSHRQRSTLFPRLAALVTGTEASIDLPLCTPAGRALGVLGIGFAGTDVLTEDLVADLQAVADLAGQALHRARLDAAERSSRRRLQLLQRFTGALSRAPDVRAVATTAVRHGAAVLGAEEAALVLRRDGDTELLAVLGGSGGGLPDGWPAPDDLVRLSTTASAPGTTGPVLALPLRLGDHLLGALCFPRRSAAGPTADDDRVLARAVAEHTTEAMLRASAADRERDAFLELQRHLLPPTLPQPPGWELAARYRPAADGSAVGGDWYDAVVLPSGRLQVIIGDVAGHGTSATAAMSELRHSLHAYLALGIRVEDALARINQAPGLHRAGLFATLLLAEIDPAAAELTLLSAGHPPPLLIPAGGKPRELPVSPNRPLGVTGTWSFRPTTVHFPPGATLLLYTDGLVERRGSDLDTDLQRLRTVVPIGLDLDATADEVLRRCAGGDDDTAMMLVRHQPVP